MDIAIFLAYAGIVAMMNRAAGSAFWGAIPSTLASRILATFVIGIATGDLALYFEHSVAISSIVAISAWAGTLLWRSWGWGKYFAAVDGTVNITEREFMPVDVIMAAWPFRLLPVSTPRQIRLWGTIAMSFRHSLIAPSVVLLSWLCSDVERAHYAAAFPLMGVAYYAGGVISRNSDVSADGVGIAELLTGFIIAIMYYGVLFT